MAEVCVNVREADGHLPAVCMCCGEPATATKARKMQWCPSWVGVLLLFGLLPYVIVASILTKRAVVQAPLCDQHQGHWLNRNLLIWGSFFLFGIIGGGAFILAANLPQPQDREMVLPFVCIGSSLLFVIWLVVVIVCQNTVIRPKEITDNEITITGVCDDFVNAVEDAQEERRRRRRERDRDRPGRWRDEEEEEDDDRPRRRRTGPSDAIEE